MTWKYSMFLYLISNEPPDRNTRTQGEPKGLIFKSLGQKCWCRDRKKIKVKLLPSSTPLKSSKLDNRISSRSNNSPSSCFEGTPKQGAEKCSEEDPSRFVTAHMMVPLRCHPSGMVWCGVAALRRVQALCSLSRAIFTESTS